MYNLYPPFGQFLIPLFHPLNILLGITRISQGQNNILNNKKPFIIMNGFADFLFSEDSDLCSVYFFIHTNSFFAPGEPCPHLPNRVRRSVNNGGEAGIRTLGALRHNGFRDRPIQPLSHLSDKWQDLYYGSPKQRSKRIPGCARFLKQLPGQRANRSRTSPIDISL